VLDEPAAGLDPEGRDEILSEVKEYHKKTGTTVLLVSHSMEDIAKYADRQRRYPYSMSPQTAGTPGTGTPDR